MTRARRWIIFAAMFLLAGIVLVTWAAPAAWLAFPAGVDQELCESTSPDLDAQIDACTRQIGSDHFWGRDLAVVHYNRGIGWKAKGEVDRAIADYTEALRLDPKNEHAYVNRGDAWSDKGDLDRAIADYTEVIRLDGANAYSLYGRGVVKLKKGDTAGGNADIAAAKAIKRDNAVVSAGYGITVDAAGANATSEHK